MPGWLDPPSLCLEKLCCCLPDNRSRRLALCVLVGNLTLAISTKFSRRHHHLNPLQVDCLAVLPWDVFADLAPTPTAKLVFA
jgi:hypothetical protein